MAQIEVPAYTLGVTSESPSGSGPAVHGFHHASSDTCTFVVHAPGGTDCIVIDPCVDYDPATSEYGFGFADGLLAFIKDRGLTLAGVFDTHIHADHLSACLYLRAAELHRRLTAAGLISEPFPARMEEVERQFGTRSAHSQLAAEKGIPVPVSVTGSELPLIQRTLSQVLHVADVTADGSQYSRLVGDGDVVALGGEGASRLEVRVMHTPGHTPSCLTYVIGDAVFCGDTLFMPDIGTARCDFPGGSATALYRSIGRILALPLTTRIFVGHDYPPKTRVFRFETSVAEQRADNIMVKDGVTEAEYVAKREARDATLNPPRLIRPSLAWNIRGGAPSLATPCEGAPATNDKPAVVFKPAGDHKACQ